MVNFFYIFGFIFLVQIKTAANVGSFYKVIGIECFPNSKYIRNATCGIKAVNWEKTHTNMRSEIVNSLQNVSLHLQVFLRNDVNQYKPFLVNITQNLCKILDRRSFPAYATIVISILREVSNVNHSCPFTGPLFVKNLVVDQKYLPIVPPIGMYKISFQFLEGYPYDDIGTVVLYIQVGENRRQRTKQKHKELI